MKALLFTSLLVADPSDILINGGLGDKLFSIVLLASFAIWMIRRQNEEKEERQKIQDRLEAYMEEDRKKMMDLLANSNNVIGQCTQVIQENTRIMQRLEILHNQNR